MKKIFSLFWMCCGLLLVTTASYAANLALQTPIVLQHSKQLLLVITKDWDSRLGMMQRYERPSIQENWVAVGAPIPVVVGKNGVAWGVGFTQLDLPGPVKREGDLRTPAGIFSIGPAFGFEEPAKQSFKMPYLQLTDNTMCVNDQNSKFYNMIINTAQIDKPDWKSSQQMRKIEQYRLGAVINYNDDPPIRGAGSCTFMHIAHGFTGGTAGCTAMAEKYAKQALTWLDSSKQPVFALFTKDSYSQLPKSWKLPADATRLLG